MKISKICLLIGIAFLLVVSCKESESHKRKRLGLDEGQLWEETQVASNESEEASSVKIDDPEETEDFSFADAIVLEEPDYKEGQYLIVKIVDGDTIDYLDNGSRYRIRILGIDTPEMNDSRDNVRYFARQAKNLMAELVDGEMVYLGLDPINNSRNHVDRYGRLLAYVYRSSDDLFVNAEMIRRGYAFSYVKYPCMYTDYFSRLEREAREAGKGMWAGN